MSNLQPHQQVFLEFHRRANEDDVRALGTRLETTMRDYRIASNMNNATAAMAVASLVGWFYQTLPAPERGRFEQLLEAHMEVAAWDGKTPPTGGQQ